MTRESCHLMTMLPEVPDPRNDKGKRHPLESILALLVLLFLGELLAVYEIVEKAQGRLETRCVIASTSLTQYLDWPGIAQVIQYHYIIKNTRTGEEKHTIHYGITSLHPEQASPEQLLAIRRGHWSIENKSHWMRGTLLGEDTSPVRCGAIP